MAEVLGAIRLKKIIQQLNTRGGLHTVVINTINDSLIEIEKRTSGSDLQPEFTFVVRVERRNDRETWWPIQYRSSSDELISCETTFNGKAMVNLVKQQSLIDLAETWARTLEAQHVAKSVGNALL